MPKYLALLSIAMAIFCLVPCANAGNLKWSGFTWEIRNGTSGPGPNTFVPENVHVESDGTLHLQIAKRDGKWTCCELSTTESLGYGTYHFTVQGKVDQFDRNVVLGLFSYPTKEVGPDGTNELDIEFSRWGKAKNPNGNFTVWPTVEKHKPCESTFELKLKEDVSTHQYIWKPGSVAFASFDGAGETPANAISNWTTPTDFSKSVSHSPMPMHINLWLFRGHPPSDGKAVEVILRDFTFSKGE